MKPPPLPSRVGRYEIVDRLGAGGMGVVYLATDPLLRRTVAIKVLPAGDDELRERFGREARSAASLRHNNVVTIYDVGEDDGQPFIAMEFLDGESMAEMIQRRAPLSVGRRLQLIVELCAGLGHAHRSGVVHRDIKPGNLMITTDGVLKVLDFGLARVASTASQTGLTRAGAVMGTPHYMSPEQVEGEPVDHRSDIFAVGVVLYELLTYQKAFSGDSAHVVLHNILHKNPTPIRTLLPSIDPDLELMVTKGLEKVPSQRYQSLNELSAGLLRVRARLGDQLEGATIVSPHQATVVDTPVSTPRKGRNLDALAQRRAAQVEQHLAAAEHHFAARAYEAVIEACENALVLDPQEKRALDLLDRAHHAIEDAQVDRWLQEAKALIDSGELTAAEALIDQSLKLRADSDDAQALQRALRERRRDREVSAERLRAARAAVDRARAHFEAGAFDAAARSATEALGYDADNAEARALKERAQAARQQVAADAVIAESRTRMAAGDGQAAITLLEQFQPQQLVASALDELQMELSRSQLPPRVKRDRVAAASPPPGPTPTPTRWQRIALGFAAVLVVAIGGWILRPQTPAAPPAAAPAPPAPAPADQKPAPAAAPELTPPAPEASPVRPSPPPVSSASAREQSSKPRRDLAESGPARPSPSPSPFVARLAEAARVFEDGDYTKAVSLYRAILDEDPGNVAATNGLRDVTRAQSIEQKFVGGASQPAPLTLEQTRQLTRHLTEAQQLQADGEYDAAITAYEAALRIDPNNTRATAGLAATRKAKAAEAAALSGLRKKPGQ